MSFVNKTNLVILYMEKQSGFTLQDLQFVLNVPLPNNAVESTHLKNHLCGGLIAAFPWKNEKYDWVNIYKELHTLEQQLR